MGLPGRIVAAAVTFLAGTAAFAREGQVLAFRHAALDLPGAPAAIVSADLDGDGRKDLLVVVAHTDWGSLGEDKIEGLTQVAEVVPALFDRREARAYLATESGGYRPAGAPLELPLSVLAVRAGLPGIPVLALTDEGIERFRFVRDERGERLALEPLVADPPITAGSATLLGALDFVRDVDGDGTADVMLPARDGLALYRGGASGIEAHPAARIAMPGDARASGQRGSRAYPLPEVSDLDGDGIPDLLVHTDETPPRIFVLKGQGAASFGAPAAVPLGCLGLGRPDGKQSENEDLEVRELAFFGDLEGNGRLEAVTRGQIDSGAWGLKQAKEPHFRYRFHRVGKDLRIEPSPYQEIEAVGYPMGSILGTESQSAFRDLDGDGRKDLVTVTLDFSVFQVARVLATRKFSIGFAFRVWAQDADGRFREVPDQKLQDRFTFDLNDLRLDRLSEIAGDLDGDGKLDFVRLGGGKTVEVRRGGPGCRFSPKADLAFELEEELADMSQVRIRDIDGDGRADLSLVRAIPQPEAGVSPPVRLDLYLSGGTR